MEQNINNPYPNQQSTTSSISQNQETNTISTNQRTSEANVNYYNYILYFFAIILLTFFIKKLLEIWKKSKKPSLPAEDDGTVCGTCGGSGKVKEKVTKYAPCGHCKQTGIDICHHCGGSGRYGVGLTVPQTEEEVQNLMKCDYCGGSGFPNPPFACCMCKGKRKESYEETVEVSCPNCKGTGRK